MAGRGGGSGAWAARLLALIVLVGAVRAPARTGGEPAALDGRGVMERVDARPRGADRRSRARWRLVDAEGRERVRETRSFWRDYRSDAEGLRAKLLIVFEAPAAVRDTAFLVWSHQDPAEDDERWIYLPALRKVRRIAGRDRSKSFVGTDFNYDDLADRGVDEDEHRLLRVEQLGGVPHYVVESTPRSPESPYGRRVEFVRAETFTQSRIDYYDPEGRLEKVLAAEWEQVEGIWVWQRLEMRSERNDHRTLVEQSEVRHDTDLPDDLFTEQSLRLGVP